MENGRVISSESHRIAPTSAAGLMMTYNTFIHIPIWLATGGKDTNPSPAMATYSEASVNQLGEVYEGRCMPILATPHGIVIGGSRLCIFYEWYAQSQSFNIF